MITTIGFFFAACCSGLGLGVIDSPFKKGTAFGKTIKEWRKPYILKPTKMVWWAWYGPGRLAAFFAPLFFFRLFSHVDNSSWYVHSGLAWYTLVVFAGWKMCDYL